MVQAKARQKYCAGRGKIAKNRKYCAGAGWNVPAQLQKQKILCSYLHKFMHTHHTRTIFPVFGRFSLHAQYLFSKCPKNTFNEC